MPNPMKSSWGGGNMKWDDLGIPVPFGGSSGEKELIRLPKELERIATSANTLLRGRLSREVGAFLALLNIIAPNDDGTKMFTANIVAASLAESGLARNEYLMGLVRMLVPSVMPSTHAPVFSHDGQGRRADKQSRAKTEENE